MIKLLVDAPTGLQQIVQVDTNGGYCPLEPERTLWDERVDGPLSLSVIPGGLVRQNGALVFSQARKDAHDLAANPIPTRAEMAAKIDAAVAAIYAKPTALSKEYEGREKQARAFKAANYTGNVPPRVQGFATPAGMTAQAATDLIISQADALLGALDALSDLRMKKYEVTRAASDALAQPSFTSTMASIAAIAAQIT